MGSLPFFMSFEFCGDRGEQAARPRRPSERHLVTVFRQCDYQFCKRKSSSSPPWGHLVMPALVVTTEEEVLAASVE